MKNRLRLAALCVGMLISGAALASAYYAGANYMASDADWEVGGTLNVQTGGTLTFNGVDKTAALAAAVVNPVADVGAAVRQHGGQVALGGSNPTIIATGLTTLGNCAVTISESTAPGLGTTALTYTTSGANLSVYAWKPTSVSNPTLIASTGTETIGWHCNGT